MVRQLNYCKSRRVNTIVSCFSRANPESRCEIDACPAAGTTLEDWAVLDKKISTCPPLAYTKPVSEIEIKASLLVYTLIFYM